MVIEPLGNIILIEPVYEGSETFRAPNDERMITSKVRVIKTGPAVTSVKDGDVVVANYWGTDSIEVGDKTLFFVEDNTQYILAKVHDEL